PPMRSAPRSSTGPAGSPSANDQLHIGHGTNQSAGTRPRSDRHLLLALTGRTVGVGPRELKIECPPCRQGQGRTEGARVSGGQNSGRQLVQLASRNRREPP